MIDSESLQSEILDPLMAETKVISQKYTEFMQILQSQIDIDNTQKGNTNVNNPSENEELQHLQGAKYEVMKDT